MSTRLTTHGLVEALARELRVAIEAITGLTLTTAEAAAPSGPGWGTPIAASGTLDGALTAWLDDASVQALSQRVTGSDDALEPSVAIDMLRELWTQATSATTLADGFSGVILEVGTPAAGTVPTSARGVTLLDNGAAMATLAVAGSVAARPGAPAAVAVRESAAVPVARPATGALSEQLAALLDVDLPLVVRFARTEMPLRALAQLGPGSMVDMGRSPDAPVQLIVGAQVIAEGEVVVVSGNYGVRITSLVSAADRLRALES